METEPETETARLTRAEIRRRYEALDQMDRELTARLVSLFQAGGSPGGGFVADRDRQVHAVAKQVLNGAGGLLKPIPEEGQTEAELYLRRDGIRLAQTVLTNAAVEAEAIEAAERVEALLPAWKPIAREWTLAAARLAAADQTAAKFQSAAGTAGHGLPMSLWIGRFTSLTDDIFAAAQDRDIVTAAELRRARRAEVGQ